ncbi:MAG: hypothetical protein OXG37_04415 [Actinomycetia bacterium]|nr:hypothetical protein [Actinomycetes bacterium]
MTAASPTLSIIQSVSATGSASNVWTPVAIAILVSAAVSLTALVLAGRRDRLDRQRQVFAEAFEAVAQYREYPFIVRRRNRDEPAKERQRISGELSQVQAKINAFEARLLVENPLIGRHYAELVKQTRHTYGKAIKEAWNADPVDADSDIHAPPYDFSAVDPYTAAYLNAVADHLSWIYTPVRRATRSLQGREIASTAHAPTATSASRHDSDDHGPQPHSR